MTPREYAQVLQKSADWIVEAMRVTTADTASYREALLKSALAGVNRVKADSWGTVDEMLAADAAWNRRPLR